MTTAAKGSEPDRSSVSLGLKQGLRRRLGGEARRLSSRHHQLEIFFDMVTDALERGSLQAARIAFTRFRDALEAHISLEDQLFFPTLRGLSPELADELDALVHEHTEIHKQLECLHDRLAEGAAEIFAADLDRFANRLADHESREERMIAGVAQKPPCREADPTQQGGG